VLAGGSLVNTTDEETYVQIANPGDTTVSVTFDLHGATYDGVGTSFTQCAQPSITLPAHSRQTVALTTLCGNKGGGVGGIQVGGTITSIGGGIVVERSTYWSTPVSSSSRNPVPRQGSRVAAALVPAAQITSFAFAYPSCTSNARRGSAAWIQSRRRTPADRLKWLYAAFIRRFASLRQCVFLVDLEAQRPTYMELFGIVLSVPAAFVASLVYCFLLANVVIRIEPLRRAMWGVSVFVLLAFALEVALLISVGAVRSRAIIGPTFYAAHVALFFLGTPALANLLVLWRPRGILRWYWAVPLCTLFAVGLVLLQYGVSEALYGIDGTEGPFSRLYSVRSIVVCADRGCAQLPAKSGM
jgi:hypothetical protein